MNMILTRDDLIALRAAMAPHSRGKRAIDNLLRRMTVAELRLETELEHAVDEELTRYAETLRDPTIGMAL
jgi:hypothetical protein